MFFVAGGFRIFFRHPEPPADPREIPILPERRMWRPSRRVCREHPGVKLPCRCGSWSAKVCRKMSLGGYPWTLVFLLETPGGRRGPGFGKCLFKKIQGFRVATNPFFVFFRNPQITNRGDLCWIFDKHLREGQGVELDNLLVNGVFLGVITHLQTIYLLPGTSKYL